DMFRQLAAKVILLDRVLAGYGSDAKPARDLLRSTFEARVGGFFPEHGQPIVHVHEGTVAFDQLERALHALSPQTDDQRASYARATEIAGEIRQMRWLAIERFGSSIPASFLLVLTFWLA